jgi:hypothetical protein
MVVGFDPAFQSVELLEASSGFPGQQHGPVPSWAVDTLSGSGGAPLSLVVAYPALREGMGMTFRVEVRDWGGMWERGPWSVIEPNVRGIDPDRIVVTVSVGSSEDLGWSGAGWTAETSSGRMTLEADSIAGTLWLSPYGTWGELRESLLLEAGAVLSAPMPPDLRGAALQATAAGAGAGEQIGRMRSLLCNSFSLDAGNGSHRPFSVRGIQGLLDGRSASALEMAVIFSAMCAELGIPAEILPVSGTRPALPVPEGWNRFLVKVTDPRGSGDEWLIEPAAYLSPAFYIAQTDTLYALEGGRISVLPPGNGAGNAVREDWALDPASGAFVLDINSTGWFDAAMRARMAGLGMDEMCLILAEWSWRSGRLVAPDSVSISDPYDLSLPVTLHAEGVWCLPEGGELTRCETVPLIDWAEPEAYQGGIIRSWTLPSDWLPPDLPGLELSLRGGEARMILAGGGWEPFPLLRGMAD